MGWSACLKAGDLKEQSRTEARGGGQMVITEVSLESGKGNIPNGVGDLQPVISTLWVSTGPA